MSPQKAFRLDNRRQLLGAYDNVVAAWEPDVIVQVDRGWRRSHRVRAWILERALRAGRAFPGRKLRQWPTNAETPRFRSQPRLRGGRDLQSLTAEILGSVDYRGLGSVECKVRANGHRHHGANRRTNELSERGGGAQRRQSTCNRRTTMHSECRRGPRASRRKRQCSHVAVKMIDSPADYRLARFYMKQHQLDWKRWRRSRQGQTRNAVSPRRSRSRHSWRSRTRPFRSPRTESSSHYCDRSFAGCAPT